mgnify:CR=1 FL=1
MTHDEMIEVIQAHKDGKAIQFMPKGGVDVEFTDRRRTDNHMDFINIDYRIKIEPKEYWLVPYLDNTGFTVFQTNPINLPAAFNSPSSVWSEGLDFYGTIHVVTVEELTND